MKKISKNHSNRKEINWLLYDIGDKFREKYTKYYKGILVDLGCGEAPYKEFFLKYCDKYIGVDWTKTLHNSKADVVSDLNKEINLNSEFADTIVSLSVIEHLYNPQKFLFESNRILKKDGILILGVPWMWPIHEEPHDYFRYTPYGLKYLLKSSGFEIIEFEATTGFFTTTFIKMNYFSVRFLRGKKGIKHKIIKFFLKPLWYISQKLGPYLDSKYPKDEWKYESQAYYIIAKKVK